jgi:hypothetical protein
VFHGWNNQNIWLACASLHEQGTQRQYVHRSTLRSCSDDTCVGNWSIVNRLEQIPADGFGKRRCWQNF